MQNDYTAFVDDMVKHITEESTPNDVGQAIAFSILALAHEVAALRAAVEADRRPTIQLHNYGGAEL